MLEELRWYKRNLQLTPEGVDRYSELASQRSLKGRAASEFAALQLLITLHPLDYVFKRLPKGTRPNFERLLEKGYAEVVEDRYGHLVATLGSYDPELLPAFRTYKKLAYEEEVSEEELDRALDILKGRALKEAETMAIRTHLDEFVEAIEAPQFRAEKAIALDAAMSKLHWDPDLIRQLSPRGRSVVGSSVLSWLRQLAGNEVSDEELESYESG